jgi:hypothetical protein
VYQCQAQDGGFTNEVLETVGDAYYTPSSLQSTARALYILHTLHNDNSDRAAAANTFLRSQIHHPSSLHLKVHFTNVTQAFPNSTSLHSTLYKSSVYTCSRSVVTNTMTGFVGICAADRET